MKPIKVFFGDRRLKDMYVGATKWEVFKFKTYRFVRKFIIITASASALMGIIYGSFETGRQMFPSVVYAQQKVEVQVPVETQIPVLDRIIQCESGGHQFSSSGQLLIKVNTNGTTDLGIAQINSVWFSIASKMGYNLAIENDNKAFAKWLFTNKGSGPWYSSAQCWNK